MKLCIGRLSPTNTTSHMWWRMGYHFIKVRHGRNPWTNCVMVSPDFLSMQTFFTMDFVTELRASDLGFTEERLPLSDDPGPSNPPPPQASEMLPTAPPLLELEEEANSLKKNHSHVTSGPQHVALSSHLVRYVKICLILLEISKTITSSNSSHAKTGKEKCVQSKFINPFRSMTTMTGNSKGLIRPPMKRKAQEREREGKSVPLSFF